MQYLFMTTRVHCCMILYFQIESLILLSSSILHLALMLSVQYLSAVPWTFIGFNLAEFADQISWHTQVTSILS